MSDDIPDFSELFPKRTSYDINRARIREIYWLANPQGHIYKDEEDDIYVIQKNAQILVIGYLHCSPHPNEVGLNDFLLKFISDIRKLCATKAWTNFEISIITDFSLRFLAPELILQLPKDIKYYILEDNSLGLSPPKYPKQQNLEHQYHESQVRRRIRVRRGPSILDEDPNSESAIMRALRNGDGDRYGL